MGTNQKIEQFLSIISNEIGRLHEQNGWHKSEIDAYSDSNASFSSNSYKPNFESLRNKIRLNEKKIYILNPLSKLPAYLMRNTIGEDEVATYKDSEIRRIDDEIIKLEEDKQMCIKEKEDLDAARKAMLNSLSSCNDEAKRCELRARIRKNGDEIDNCDKQIAELQEEIVGKEKSKIGIKAMQLDDIKARLGERYGVISFSEIQTIQQAINRTNYLLGDEKTLARQKLLASTAEDIDEKNDMVVLLNRYSSSFGVATNTKALIELLPSLPQSIWDFTKKNGDHYSGRDYLIENPAIIIEYVEKEKENIKKLKEDFDRVITMDAFGPLMGKKPNHDRDMQFYERYSGKFDSTLLKRLKDLTKDKEDYAQNTKGFFRSKKTKQHYNDLIATTTTDIKEIQKEILTQIKTWYDNFLSKCRGSFCSDPYIIFSEQDELEGFIKEAGQKYEKIMNVIEQYIQRLKTASEHIEQQKQQIVTDRSNTADEIRKLARSENGTTDIPVVHINWYGDRFEQIDSAAMDLYQSNIVLEVLKAAEVFGITISDYLPNYKPESMNDVFCPVQSKK